MQPQLARHYFQLSFLACHCREYSKKAYKSGVLTKDNINKRGYNKSLEINKDVKVAINREKVKDGTYWDGLKRYTTNTRLAAKTLSNNVMKFGL